MLSDRRQVHTRFGHNRTPFGYVLPPFRAGRANVADVERGLRERLDAFFARYADPRYDLWHGGTTKAGRMLQEGQ